MNRFHPEYTCLFKYAAFPFKGLKDVFVSP